MEKYFTPVHKPMQEEIQLTKKKHHKGAKSHIPGQKPSSSRNIHHHGQHNDYHQHFNQEVHENQQSHHRSLSRASSSTTSSSSMTSSSSWSSEPNLDNETYLTHGSKPQYSFSCSNIPEAGRKFQDEDSEDVDFDLRSPTPFYQRSQQHQQQSQQCHQGSERAPRFSKLHRGHSRSEEGLLQEGARVQGGRERKAHVEHGHLYKTASLGRSLAFSDDAEIALGVGKPKKAVSSIQLPSKGILKNKDGGLAANQRPNFRKAKSMEVLSTRVQVTGPGGGGAPGPLKSGGVEARRENIVKEKIQFSAFLDEITRQVISPSRLNSFGVTSGPPLPKSHEEQKDPLGGMKKKDEDGPQAAKPQPRRPSNPSPAADLHLRRGSHPGKLLPDNRRTDSPNNLSNSRHKRRSSQDMHHSVEEGMGCRRDTKHRARYSQLVTDGTSTSPEPVLSESKRHHPRQRGGSRGSSSFHHPRGDHQGSPPPPGHTAGPECESPSSKSSTASPSSEQGDGKKYSGQRRHSKQHRDSVSAADRVQLLEQYNKELHENLLQTVACIENMEAELQGTRAELNGLKEKSKRLQESYSTSQQSNSLLEQKLQTATESMNSERKYLLQRIVELTKQLDTAQSTINSLENINVPSLIKELLEKHLKSEDAVKNLHHSANMRDSRNHQSEKAEDTVFEWPNCKQSNSNPEPLRVTAFLPWKPDQKQWAGPGEVDRAGMARGREDGDHERCARSHSPSVPGVPQLPFTVAEISMALFKSTAEGHAQSCENEHGFYAEAHSTQRCISMPPNPYDLDKVCAGKDVAGAGKRGARSLGPDDDEMTAMTAQRILNNFLCQIQAAPAPQEKAETITGGVIDWPGGP
ncbi:uncharacterized protein LOC114768263 [Denticeps clupeoides]|uniref:uncharacterized protein LOC114768263 n=1 Tax=Denticeps clupeoides TaxID=299321 RepID=UPI0010A564EE|nr:uncharacterized protein LOC114768263 [Denticeps clupeoides]